MANLTPANRVEKFTVTCAAGTLQSTPLITPLPLGVGNVVHLYIDIPKGHSYATGLQLRMAGGQVVPKTRGAYIVGDDDHLDWNLTGQLDSGAWQAYTFNTGKFPHAWHLTFAVLDFAYSEVGPPWPPLEPVPVLV